MAGWYDKLFPRRRDDSHKRRTLDHLMHNNQALDHPFTQLSAGVNSKLMDRLFLCHCRKIHIHSNVGQSLLIHPPHSCPAKFAFVCYSIPLVCQARYCSSCKTNLWTTNKHFLKLNFSATITIIDKRCVLLINI